MNYNSDGFNERSIYIHNNNDRNKVKSVNFDNSFAKMRVEERKNNVETVNTDQSTYVSNVRGTKDNFILRNNNMRNANSVPNQNNPVLNALNKNMTRR